MVALSLDKVTSNIYTEIINSPLNAMRIPRDMQSIPNKITACTI